MGFRKRQKVTNGLLLCASCIWILFLGINPTNAQFSKETHRVEKKLSLPSKTETDQEWASSASSSNANGNKIESLLSGRTINTGRVSFPIPQEEIRFVTSADRSAKAFRFPSEKKEDNSDSAEENANTRRREHGREMTEAEEAAAAATGGLKTNSDSSRKAKPDVQDIIDGIVKLLGGKVHPPTTSNPPSQIPTQTQYAPSNKQYQQQANQFPKIGQAPYNLFNPTKPLFPPPPPQPQNPKPNRTSVKPSRINDRGPSFLINTNNGNKQQQQQQQQNIPPSSFEAIPLGAINSEFSLNQKKFGPPFPLPTTGTRFVSTPAEAPYKKGVPLPEQLVPDYINNQENNGGELLNIGNQQQLFTSSEIEDDENEQSYRPQSSQSPPPQKSEKKKNINRNKKPGTLPIDSGSNLDLEPTNEALASSEILIPPPSTSSSIIKSSYSTGNVQSAGTSMTTIFQFSQLTTTSSSSTETINPTKSSVFYSSSFSSSSSSSSSFEKIHSSYSVSGNSNSNYTSQQQQPINPPTTSITPFQSGSFNNPVHKATPPLRPGIVFHEGPANKDKQQPSANNKGQGYGSVEVVTAIENGPNNKPGEIFDITVTAQQNFGGQVTGQPFVVPVDLKDDIITHANGNQQFVSIDGKRTYFNLHPSTSSIPNLGAGTVTQTFSGIIPQIGGGPTSSSSSSTEKNRVGIPLNYPIGNTRGASSVSTTLNIAGGGGGGSNGSGSVSISGASSSSSSLSSSGLITGTKRPSGGPPNIIRRPFTRRPSPPSIRIDTCIVGDPSTCNSSEFEVCKTETGVSSCVCKSGYARRRHREPCKAVVSLSLSMRVDRLAEKKLEFDTAYFDPNSEIYQSLEWEAMYGMDTALSETTLQAGYIGSKLTAIGYDGRQAVINTTVLIQDNPNFPPAQIKRELHKQLIQALTRNKNNFGKSQLMVDGPISAVAAITDSNECENEEMNDCHPKAQCVNTFGSFECKCEQGYGDPFGKDKRRSGRNCESCSGKHYCNGRGECLIESGQRVCKCAGNYYGSACDIDGEVLAVAIGASVSAVVIIGLTLLCLCLWSRRWKREEQKAALMSRTLFGGVASQAMSYLSKNATMNSNNPYQQHLTSLDGRYLTHVAESNINGNIYVQSEPMSLHHHSSPMMGPPMDSPPIMAQRRSIDTCETSVEEMFGEERHHQKRPRSRASQLQGGIYYDLEPDSQQEIYGSRSMIPYPGHAQFCVSPAYVHRGFYN